MKFLVVNAVMFDFPGDKREELVQEAVQAMKIGILRQTRLELVASGISEEHFHQHVTMFEPTAMRSL